MRERDDWILNLDEDALAELDDAASRVRDRPIASITPDDFHLPKLGEQLRQVQREVIDGRGFAVIRGIDVSHGDLAHLGRVYWGLGTWLGEAISQNPNGHLLGHVTDIGADVDNPNQRGYQSSDALPFHTDVAADIVGLFCLRPAARGGASSIVSSVAMHNAMLEQAPDLLELLFESWYWDRRGEVPEGYEPWYRLPVFSHHEERLMIAFIRRFIVSAERHDDVPALSASQHLALDTLQDIASDPSVHLAMDFRPGDIQLINNCAILHSREGYTDDLHPDRRRHLLRLWLTAANGWALPDEFYDRYPGRTAAGRPDGIRTKGTVLKVSLDPRAA
jgi:hypothetical protein